MTQRVSRAALAVLSAGLLAGCDVEEPPRLESGEMPTAVNLCVGCHGTDGQAVIAGYPHITGQDATYLLNQLRAYRDGERTHAAMNGVVGSLDDQELAATAAWYAAQDPCPAVE